MRRPVMLPVLLVVGVAVGCSSGGTSLSTQGVTGSPSPTPKITATPQQVQVNGTVPVTDTSPLPVTVVALPSNASPTPGASSTSSAPPSILRVGISTDSLYLNVPQDPQAIAAGYASANFPTSYRLVGTVYYSDGSTTTSVTWTSSDLNLLTVDTTGLVSTTNFSIDPTGSPLGGSLPATYSVTVTAAAEASPSITASIPVTVNDLGNVQLDVY